MPSSSSLPDSPQPPQNPPAAGGDHFDRMEAELKALQQQAQATQQSLQQLQTRSAVDPVSAVVTELPGMATVDSTMLGVGSVLVLASVVAWWFMWQRPRTRWIDAPRTDVPRQAPPISARVPLPDTGGPVLYAPGNSTQPPSAVQQEDALDWDLNSVSGDTTQPHDPSSPFVRQDPNISFDSAAAATEVMRVRKSLAEKREARAYLLEREDGTLPPAQNPDLDLDLDLDEPALPSAHAWLEPLPAEAPTTPVAPATPTRAEVDAALDLDLGLDPWRQPGETLPGGDDADALADAVHLSFTLEDYGMAPPPAPTTPASAAPIPPKYTMDQPPEASTDAADDLDLGLEPSLTLELKPTPTMEATPTALQPPAEPLSEPPSAGEPAPEPDHQDQPHGPGSKNYDFTITMALAHESAALELWPEARDLASEVLESDDPALVSEALSLLERLNQLELNAPPDTSWNTMR